MTDDARDTILFEEGTTYRVRLEGFEGPLDLLLHLIRRHRYDIYDIPIARILEEYLGVLEVMSELDLEVAGEFLVMAATLAEIKSRMLLPVSEEEEVGEEDEDPRAELVRRLIEYERIRGAAEGLEGRPRLGREVFNRAWRAPDLDEIDRPDAPIEADLFQLLVAFQQVVAEAPETFIDDIARERVSIQTAIAEILDHFRRVPEGVGVSFRELFPPRPTRDRVVSVFLALLELVRLRAVRAVQVSPFGEIRLYAVPLEEE